MPGAKIETWARWETASIEGVWMYNSGKPGPTTGLMVGVHGDERAGPLIAQGLLRATNGPVIGGDLIGELTDKEQVCVERAAGYFSELEIACGSLLVMLGNLRAMRERTRLYNGDNLNRWLRDPDHTEQTAPTLSYVQARGRELLPYMSQCHTLLDLHEYTGNRPFLIAERGPALTAASYLATDPRTVLSCNWNQIEPGGADGYMFDHGKVGICFELGCKYYPQKNIRRGAMALKRLLAYQGQLPHAARLEKVVVHTPILEMTRAVMYARSPFRLAEPFDHFQVLRPGQLIATQGTGETEERIYAAEGGSAPEVIVFPKRRPRRGAEAFCLGHYVPE